MQRKAFWGVTGISAATAFVAGGGGPVDTLNWLADLCLTGTADGAMDGEMPMIAMEMENHRAHILERLAPGLSIIGGAMVVAGFLPEEGDIGGLAADPDKILAAMTYVANATGGVDANDLRATVEATTGMELSEEDALLAMDVYSGAARPEHLAWIAEGETGLARDVIMRAALKVGWIHGEFSESGLAMIAQMAEVMELGGDDLALLFWEATAPPDAATEPAPADAAQAQLAAEPEPRPAAVAAAQPDPQPRPDPFDRLRARREAGQLACA
ncbi:MAG: hypothetical protein AAF871_04780 [Pseudomonadota bacterium]